MASQRHSATKKELREAMVDDEEAVDFLAILFTVAQSLDHVRNNSDVPMEEAIGMALRTQRQLLNLANRLFPGRHEMEERIIAFAARLRLDEMPFCPTKSNGIH